ncbi:MAG: class I SAM-dependent methyltransferase, partial [Dehalococcoidia bacterium]
MSIFDVAANAVARRTFFGAVSHLKVGKLTVEMPDGTTRVFDSENDGPSGVLQVKDDNFFSRVIFHGEIGFGEAYQARLCDSPDLVALIRLAILNRREVDLNKGPLKLLSKRKNIRLHRSRSNTMHQSKHNIHDHYDLGNDFFKLFLDDTMTYSSAVFDEPDQDLADAQRSKYRRIAELACITKNDHVLEIGTGWGGFAIFAAGTYGCRVTSVTISKEQLELAVERIDKAGLSDLIDVQMLDYREISGTFDKIVSIEMFEA